MSNSVHNQQPKNLISRRHLLKALAAAGGAVAASALLPAKWAKPLVEVGTLPAHAQISEPEIPDTVVQLTWLSMFEMADLDLRSSGDGATVNENNPNSPTMAWTYEEIPGDYIEFVETITIISAAASGNYEIYALENSWSARNAGRQQQQGVILSITLPNEPTVSRDIINALQLEQWVHCATINFDTLTITWHV